jgi:hypothetical protein
MKFYTKFMKQVKRGQKTKIRGQTTEDRKKSEIRGQREDVEGMALRPVGGWRSASLEVGGKGKIISNCGLRNREPARRVGVRRTIANLKDRGRRTDDRGQMTARSRRNDRGTHGFSFSVLR